MSVQKVEGPAQRYLPALRDMLEKCKGEIAKALPKHLTPERMIRVAITAVQMSPKLLECSPISILGCVMRASELGLELAGPLGQAYMVPYFNKHSRRLEAQFQVGYRGLQVLAYRSGKVSSIPGRVVYRGDQFSYRYGSLQRLDHVPSDDASEEIVAVYAVARFTEGGSDFEVMTARQIQKHRAHYSKAGAGSPWDSAFEEMAKKTVIRRLAKRLPMAVEMQQAAMEDEYVEAGVPVGAPLLTGAQPPELAATQEEGDEAFGTAPPPEQGAEDPSTSEPPSSRTQQLEAKLARERSPGEEEG